MPVYRFTVEKFYSLAGEYWTNVYYADAETGSNSFTITDALVNAEKALYTPATVVTKVGITLPGSQNATVLGANIYNVAGTGAVGAELYPLFAVARVDFSVANSRPSRKFIRAFLQENFANGLTIEAAALTRLQTYADAIVAIAGICDVDGQAIISGAPKPAVAMRQLRRGSKKSVTP